MTESARDIVIGLLWLINAVSSSLILLVGLVSWIALPKFRTFGNYVFLNTVLASLSLIVLSTFNLEILDLLAKVIDQNVVDSIVFGIFIFNIGAFNIWLSICCVMFYVQIVQVFGADVTRRYLKVALCGWLSPALIAIFAICAGFIEVYFNSRYQYSKIIRDILILIVLVIIFCPLIVNGYMYVKVMLALMKSRTVETKRRVQMATLVFVMTGALFFVGIMAFFSSDEEQSNDHIIKTAFLIMMFVQGLLINIYFLMFKSNWILWCQGCVINQPTPV